MDIYIDATMSGLQYMTSASKPKVIVEAPFDGKIMSDVLAFLRLSAEVVPVKRYAELNDIDINGDDPNYRQAVIKVTENSELCWGLVDRDTDRLPAHDRVVITDAWDMECSMFFMDSAALINRVLSQLCVEGFGADNITEELRNSFVSFSMELIRALDYIFRCRVVPMRHWRQFYNISDDRSLSSSLNATLTTVQIIDAIETRLGINIDRRDLRRYTLRLERVNGHVLVNALALALVSDTRLHTYFAPANVVRDVINLPEVYDMHHRINAILIQSADVLIGARFVDELSRKISS
jgi:hypothetical protein